MTGHPRADTAAPVMALPVDRRCGNVPAREALRIRIEGSGFSVSKVALPPEPGIARKRRSERLQASQSSWISR
jgi:hypothetical protein